MQEVEGRRKVLGAPEGRGHHVVSHKSTTQELQDLVAPHLDSFNFFLQQDGGLERSVELLRPHVLAGDESSGRAPLRVWVEDAQVSLPRKSEDTADTRLFPAEARQRGLTYSGQLVATVCFQAGDGPVVQVSRSLGDLPLMVRSARCHLQHATREEMVRHKEEANEMGGYFILNGIERIMRLLILPRRNHALGMVRPAFTNRGPTYTEFGCQIRCVRPDQTAQTVTLHYLSEGTCRLRFTYRKQEFFLPAVVVLRALVDCTDREIYDAITQGDRGNTFVADRTEIMLRESKELGLRTRAEVLRYLGKFFGVVMPSSGMSDRELGEVLVRDVLFVHCCGADEATNQRDKYNVLVGMVRKLYALVEGRIRPDNMDALNNHELLLPGHLYGSIVKEKIDEWVGTVRSAIVRDLRLHPERVDYSGDAYFRKVMSNLADVGRKVHYFLVTGNLVSNTGLDLMQTSGFTVVAEKLNFFRYMSHFRSVHRGQFFTTMKTTSVRKLLPESWGFMCPVHTPDGSPCGLLNHLAAACKVQAHPCPVPRARLEALLCGELGVRSIRAAPGGVLPASYLPVVLDGIPVGAVAPGAAASCARRLRHLKVSGHDAVFRALEICAVLDERDGVQLGLFLSTGAARLLRPVKYLGGAGAKAGGTATSKGAPVEWVGPMEQVYMDIACDARDFREGETTHVEITPRNILSVIAGFTPFSDHNQSPRNMYQCQMGKQTMGTPYHSHVYRTDNKVYRIQTPQTPMVRNESYARYMQDEYPLGTNAVVAVISYTGYDMEDAMIMNKGSYERGFGHGSVYKSKFIDLADKRMRGEPVHHRFSNVLTTRGEDGATLQKRVAPSLADNGLPHVGDLLQPGDPLYCVVDDTTNQPHVTGLKDTEAAYVEEVRALGSSAAGELQRVCIKLRYPRNPIIGDKFSSRHGQKGVMSRLWPVEDMPFTESGMMPDIIFNPHGLPSRMTVGQIVESMAGKSSSLHGLFQDSSPFQYSERDRAADCFGKQLLAAGYNYCGNETLYSGITGEELKVDIFVGIVYYQRLRHMVSDKYQARATGPVNAITRQPIGGRKMQGGIRFGEMERDSMLSHGTAYLLHDRLMMCSDYHTASVCTKCGSLIAPVRAAGGAGGGGARGAKRVDTCRNCKSSRTCATVAVPYVFTYLVNELAAMGIRVSLDVK